MGADSDGIATATTKPGFILRKDHDVYGTWLRLFFQETEYTERYHEG